MRHCALCAHLCVVSETTARTTEASSKHTHLSLELGGSCSGSHRWSTGHRIFRFFCFSKLFRPQYGEAVERECINSKFLVPDPGSWVPGFGEIYVTYHLSYLRYGSNLHNFSRRMTTVFYTLLKTLLLPSSTYQKSCHFIGIKVKF